MCQKGNKIGSLNKAKVCAIIKAWLLLCVFGGGFWPHIIKLRVQLVTVREALNGNGIFERFLAFWGKGGVACWKHTMRVYFVTSYMIARYEMNYI